MPPVPSLPPALAPADLHRAGRSPRAESAPLPLRQPECTADNCQPQPPQRPAHPLAQQVPDAHEVIYAFGNFSSHFALPALDVADDEHSATQSMEENTLHEATTQPNSGGSVTDRAPTPLACLRDKLSAVAHAREQCAEQRSEPEPPGVDAQPNGMCNADAYATSCARPRAQQQQLQAAVTGSKAPRRFSEDMYVRSLAPRRLPPLPRPLASPSLERVKRSTGLQQMGSSEWGSANPQAQDTQHTRYGGPADTEGAPLPLRSQQFRVPSRDFGAPVTHTSGSGNFGQS